MGNAHVTSHSQLRNKKQVHWKAADRSKPPGKPELVPEAEGSPDLITLRWCRPVNDGGSPISGYFVEHKRVGSPHWVRATPLSVPLPEITLSGLEPGWRYQFRVSAQNAVGYSDPSVVSEPITVTLQRSAVTAPKFTQEINDTTALENDKCEFLVHFLGQPPSKISWFKDGFEIFSSRRIRILTEFDRSILTIHQTSLSDEGEIKCTATNRAGHISCKARLMVEAPPSIRLPRNYEEGLLFEIGETIRLKVSVVGRPPPLIFWSHDGTSLQNNDRCEIESADKISTLKITEARRSDRGEYQIKAVNKLGTDVASFLVTVTDKPSPPGKATVVMTLGRSVTLSWSSPVDDGGCKIGNYIVEYYRLGWNVWLKAATSRQLTTRLGDLIEGSEYKFRIKAESPYGVSEPSEESEVVFIPDPKRGITHPSPKSRSRTRDSEITSPIYRNRPARSHSFSRVESYQEEEPSRPPIRPKRTKSRSQHQTPESSPMLSRRYPTSQINKSIFDRSSLARDMAYGSPDIMRLDDEKSKILESSGASRNDKTVSNQNYLNSNMSNQASYNALTKHPSNGVKPKLTDSLQISSPESNRKLIRQHSATVSGSSEFMLVLYSDENITDPPNTLKFNESSVPPPLSLSAPELNGCEEPQFPLLKSFASSSELLHERAMRRFCQAAEAEERESEKVKNTINSRRPSYEIPKIKINSQDNEELVGINRTFTIEKKGTREYFQDQPANQSDETATKISRKGATNLSFSDMRDEPNFENKIQDKNSPKKVRISNKEYSQQSFEKRPVTSLEERRWREEFEESFSDSDTDSDPDFERLKFEMSRNRDIHTHDRIRKEEETYRPPGGLSGMKASDNEPFEILNKRRQLPDPNFVPKPILKKSDSPSVSPTISPPLSPVKVPRALSPRPDIILQRNRSKSLAVPALSTLVSSGDESDEQQTNFQRNRSSSLTSIKYLPFKKKERIETEIIQPRFDKPFNSTLPNIAAVAQISGITAASIVIPKNLLDKQKNVEETKVVADHYDSIVKNYSQRRRSNPILETFDLKKIAENSRNDWTDKDNTPSKESLSQDSGYQSVSGYRRSSITDYHNSATLLLSNNVVENDGKNTTGQAGITKDSSKSTQKPDDHNIDSIKEQKQRLNISPLQKSIDMPSQKKMVTTISRERYSSHSQSPTKRRGSANQKREKNILTSLTLSNLRTPSPSLTVRKSAISKDITTQTLESRNSGTSKDTTNIESDKNKIIHENNPDKPQDELVARAQINVSATLDYLLDLGLFFIACWLYFLKDELLVIPILTIMLYRKLKQETRNKISGFIITVFRKFFSILRRKDKD